MAYGIVADRLLRCAPGTVCEVECAPQESHLANDIAVPPPIELDCRDGATCAPRRCVDRHLGLADIVLRIRTELWYPGSLSGIPPCGVNADPDFGAPALTAVMDELCVQEASEAQWEHLLSTLAPACRLQRYEGGRLQADPLSPVRDLIGASKAVVTGLAPGVACPTELELPPHHEVSLHEIANPPSP